MFMSPTTYALQMKAAERASYNWPYCSHTSCSAQNRTT